MEVRRGKREINRRGKGARECKRRKEIVREKTGKRKERKKEDRRVRK